MSIYTRRGVPVIGNLALGKEIYFTGANCTQADTSHVNDGDFMTEYWTDSNACDFTMINGEPYKALVVPLKEMIHIKQVAMFFSKQWTFSIHVHNGIERKPCVENWSSGVLDTFYQVMCDFVTIESTFLVDHKF